MSDMARGRGATAKSARIEIIGRGEVLVGGSLAVALGLLLGSRARAQTPGKPGASIEDALRRIMGEAKPAEGKIVLDVPEIAENGNTVPFTLSVDSPMTEQQYVKAAYILAPGNPQMDVVTFSFTPLSGKASVTSRMRLAKSQDVYAVAALSDGTFQLAKRMVKVTIGGCGG
jgi:sulfur-oxidizing protein SoxY